MGKLVKGVESTTQKAGNEVTSLKNVKKSLDFANTVGSNVQDAYTIAGKAVLLSLSKAWLGISVFKPATTEKTLYDAAFARAYARSRYKGEESKTPEADRFDTSKMWAIKFGDFFMPMSQTYTVRAKKTLNTSSLVDGIDIIQQTRKEAKTIDCTLKISVNENQENLKIIEEDEKGIREVTQLQKFLAELYEEDVVFQVDNETINDTIKVDYVIMSSYRFLPRAGSKVYIFEFSLTEVKFGDNVLTFDETQIQEPSPVIQDDSLIA